MEEQEESLYDKIMKEELELEEKEEKGNPTINQLIDEDYLIDEDFFKKEKPKKKVEEEKPKKEEEKEKPKKPKKVIKNTHATRRASNYKKKTK